MMLYENIKNESEIIDFVKKLNQLSHLEKYKLFNNVFQPNIFSIRADGFPVTENTHFQKWFFNIASFTVFTTVKINKKNRIDNPDYETGFYECLSFHLHPDDTTGISQKIR